MPRLVVAYTELGGGKLKRGNGFLKPNFGLGPSPVSVSGIGAFIEPSKVSRADPLLDLVRKGPTPRGRN